MGQSLRELLAQAETQGMGVTLPEELFEEYAKDHPIYKCLNNIDNIDRRILFESKVVKRDPIDIADGLFADFPEKFPNWVKAKAAGTGPSQNAKQVYISKRLNTAKKQLEDCLEANGLYIYWQD